MENKLIHLNNYLHAGAQYLRIIIYEENFENQLIFIKTAQLKMHTLISEDYTPYISYKVKQMWKKLFLFDIKKIQVIYFS